MDADKEEDEKEKDEDEDRAGDDGGESVLMTSGEIISWAVILAV